MEKTTLNERRVTKNYISRKRKKTLSMSSNRLNLNQLVLTFVLTLTLQLKPTMATLPNVVKLGGLFENGDETVEMAFRDAVERINSDETILPNTRLEAVIEKLERCDSFQASKKGIKIFI